MTSEIDHAKVYGQARNAYIQGNYHEAAKLISQMAAAFPADADVLLLQGHISVSLEQFDLACQQYESVLQITDRSDLLDCARQALEQARQRQSQIAEGNFSFGARESIPMSEPPTYDPDPSTGQTADFANWQADNSEAELESEFPMEGLDWDSAVFAEDDFGEPTLGQSRALANPFDDEQKTTFSGTLGDSAVSHANPFAQENPVSPALNWQDLPDNDAPEFSLPAEENTTDNPYPFPDMGDIGEPTFVVSSDLGSNSPPANAPFTDKPRPSFQSDNSAGRKVPHPFWGENAFHEDPTIEASPQLSSRSLSSDDSFLDNLDAFNDEDLEGMSKFDLTQMGQDMPDSDLFTRSGSELSGNIGSEPSSNFTSKTSQNQINWVKPDDKARGDLSATSSRFIKPTVEVTQGKLAWFTNAPLGRKQWIAATATGVTTLVVVLLVGGMAALLAPKPKPQLTATSANKGEKIQKPSSKASPDKQPKTTPAAQNTGSPVFLLALLGGLASFGSSLLLGQLTLGQTKRSVEDLQTQFDAIYEGNFNVKATVYSEDELGQLATRFNQMSRTILTTTSEAQQRAAETEQAKEELQRQVIRLLDEVEGAARGDLTVEAEVTADVLGAVADAFNLTIHNLRGIVRQVKTTAKEVNKSSTDSELFARKNSTDSLQMAEELAVTLNSVQMMTESIQRVSENAREAEEVAHTSSVTALKGGEAVERTVVGILQIRETVSETARKVKRLAEASQEISKIVALISQIASRTNLLALNASIQAARAGEAGRGFAIVADEVRQLADRSAKSLKEIEQIVLQIQSETGSVMTAMEEGIQQVIDVTDKSEQAKRSLEDIISVSNRINSLVRSITGDTVKQRENSRAVTQVMQSVELTAQETAQESQRVAGSLQNLVSISRDLLGSVEKFRVDSQEKG